MRDTVYFTLPKKRVVLNLSDVELGTDDDMIKYEDNSIQIEY